MPDPTFDDIQPGGVESQAIPAEHVHNSLQDQIDILSSNLQGEIVARQALESRLAALESSFATAVSNPGGTRAN